MPSLHKRGPNLIKPCSRWLLGPRLRGDDSLRGNDSRKGRKPHLLGQIPPVPVPRFDQRDLQGPVPALDPLFPQDGFVDVGMRLEPHQPRHAIAPCEALHPPPAVFRHLAKDVIRHAAIKRAVAARGEKVDEIAVIAHGPLLPVFWARFSDDTGRTALPKGLTAKHLSRPLGAGHEISVILQRRKSKKYHESLSAEVAAVDSLRHSSHRGPSPEVTAHPA